MLFQRLFLEKTSFLYKTSFLKAPLPFIAFVNYERAYLVEGITHILCSYLDVALTQLCVITKASMLKYHAEKKKYVEKRSMLKKRSIMLK